MSRKYSSVSLETEVVGSLTTTATSIVVANATNLLGGIAAANETIMRSGVNATAGQYDGFETLIKAGGSGAVSAGSMLRVMSCR